ncbi:unnamed protein product [Rotaria sp. Silwood1]|nr:unnamed protein product [Rotaria sp. Silwood1]CAF1628395.1 unnamed protein product [Rotaria sp. Silwood1]CAF3808899.1 unnamed protein product [Rotaria sp. Silwood1]
MEKAVHQIEQVRRIYVYYDVDDHRQSGQSCLLSGSKESEKFEFCLERNLEKQLENAETGGAVDPSQPIDRSMIENITDIQIERIGAKRANNSDRYSPVPKSICCSICSEFILKNKAWFDRGFENELYHLLTTCLECAWTGSFKFYQKHVNQNHQEFSNNSITNQQVVQNSLNQMHQQILSILCIIRSSNNSNVNDNQILGAISTLLNSTKNLNDDMHRINRESGHYQHLISIEDQQWSIFEKLAQEIDGCIRGVEINQNLLYQQLLLLKEHVEDAQSTSSDGAFMWKITNFEEKTMDAKYERYKSIDLPPFYSFQTGYKMCLRLFLNGDNNTRGTHMSLYLVIMQGNDDTILSWPLKLKITFNLLNQLSSENNHSVSFWSKTTSSSFQRPTTDMNIAYGIPKFFPLNVFQQNKDQFVRDDALFIKVETDFLTKMSGRIYLLINILISFI